MSLEYKHQVLQESEEEDFVAKSERENHAHVLGGNKSNRMSTKVLDITRHNIHDTKTEEGDSSKYQSHKSSKGQGR